jgi:hypothetical protein
MAYAIQRRRGTSTEHNSFTGLVGEITIDTTNNTIRVHDGSTAGGHRLAKYSEINTQENIEDAVSGLLTAGSGISLSYDDAAGTLTITNTTSAGDIEAVTAGDGLSGGGTSGAVSLALDLNELTAAAVDVSADSIAIIDAGDSSSKKESIADLATAMAGTNLTASSGTLGFADSVMDARISNAIKDEDNMASDSATHVPSQQSVKAFVASQIATKDNTDEMTEGSTNLYFTNARARGAISVGGDLAYNSGTGVISFTNDAGDIEGVTAGDGLTGGGTTGTVGLNVGQGTGITVNADDIAVNMGAFDTDNLSEGSSNLYHTTARARGSVSVTDAGGDGSLAYNSTSGVITYTGPSAAEVRAHLTAGDGLDVSSGSFSVDNTVVRTSGTQSIAGAKTFSNDIVVSGNLTVSGTQTTVATETLTVDDNMIVLNNNEAGTPSQDAGIEVERGTSTNVKFQFKESTDRWQFTNDGSTFFNLPTSTADVAENTNLYYTNARADARITAALIDEDNMASNSATRLPSQQSVKAYVDGQTTDETAEGSSNLYYTDARVKNYLGGGSFDGHIIPSANITYDLGSLAKQWRDIYVGPGSLYVNGQQVLSDNSGTITVSADTNQNISVISTGSGDVELTAGGAIQLKSDITLTTNKTISSTGGVKFASNVNMNSNNINNLDDPVANQDAATKAYVDATAQTTEEVQDIVGALISGSGNISATYNDSAGTLVISEALTTTDITEGDNKYFSNARARGAVSVTDAGGDGSLAYNSTSGVITYTGPSASEVRAHLSGGTGITYNSSTGVITTTDGDIDIHNLSGYVANEHIDHSGVSIIAGTGLTGGGTIAASRTVNVGAGTGITVNADDVAVNMGAFDTDDLNEGSTNLYFTNERVDDRVNALIVDGNGIDAVYDDAAGTLTLSTPSGTAGNGLTYSSGVINAVGGDGITASANSLDLDSSVVRTTGTQTIAGAKTFSDAVVMNGDLTVNGTTTTVNSTTVSTGDNIIILNSDVTGTPSEDSGFEVERGDSTNKQFLWKESTDRWLADAPLDATGYYITGVGEVINSSGAWTGSSSGLKGEVGPTGPQGPQGNIGPQGATGPQGAQGPQGTAGDKGATGATGPQGAQGPAGSNGSNGSDGDKGQKGEVGAQGPQGNTGAQGSTGAKGQKGEIGAQGPQGATGPTGPQGNQGGQGAQGPQGQKGATGTTGATGPQGAQGGQGQKGATGAQGGQGATGPTGPSGNPFPGGTFSGDITTRNIIATGPSGTYNIGSSSVKFGTMYANTFNGTATSAQYADLAERYEADKPLEPGTVVCFGGDKEVTACAQEGHHSVAGVVSTNPAHLMNAEAGSEATHPAIALAGRVPVKVVGPVHKGDLLVSSGVEGRAKADNDAKAGRILGKAMESAGDGEHVIEGLINLM